jgi:hypothetical protein
MQTKLKELNYSKLYLPQGHKRRQALKVTISWQSRGNDRNYFSIASQHGCDHETISKVFPELRKYIKFHLFDEVGPLHYLENSLYHAANQDLAGLRHSAAWPDASIDDMLDPLLKVKLLERHPVLMAEFRQVIADLGFDYCKD